MSIKSGIMSNQHPARFDQHSTLSEDVYRKTHNQFTVLLEDCPLLRELRASSVDYTVYFPVLVLTWYSTSASLR